MKRTLLTSSLSILLAVSILFAGCASSTMIKSIPSGAKVFIDGEPVGTTPYLYSDTKIVGSVVNVDIKKDGFKPLYTSFTRTEEVNGGAIVGGIFFLFPFLWTMDYKPVHIYELEPLTEQVVTDSIVSDNQSSVTDSPKIQKLRELKKMLDEKLITKEEYEKQKAKILEEK